MIKVFPFLILLFAPFTGEAQTSPQVIRKQLSNIVERDGVRSYEDTVTLNAVGRYIEMEFLKHSSTVRRQVYQARGVDYFNVIATVGDTNLPRVVIGAHYDVCGKQQGADDNGTGVVGLLQALEQLKDYSGPYCLEFVAYTLEEPPYFASHLMGSYVHANDLYRRGVKIHGMLALEMIGYFSDVPGSQSYPLSMLKWFYGKTGDYITVVRKMNKGPFTRNFSRKYKRKAIVTTKKFTGPRRMTGIDFSDHRNYWDLGIDALMLTDTAFYRNKNYHKSTDTIDTIDFVRMAQVIDGLVETLRDLK